MGLPLGYGERDSTPYTILSLVLTSIFCLLAFFQWNLFSLIEDSSPTFHTSWAPLGFVVIWRFVCAAIGLSAVVYMFRTTPGVMPVIRHKERTEEIIHPVGIQHFVTFSSWTLLINILYFLLSGIVTLSILIGTTVPILMDITVIIFFSAAAGSSFLTSTVVRHIILPEEVRIGRVNENMFNFHNQLMHNLAAIFIAVDLIIIQPILYPEFAVFGLFFGLLYVVFAYIFAFYGGGFYVYTFIDPRLKFAPLLMSALAVTIATFYLGLWGLSQLISYNYLIGTVVLVLWVSLIVQFRSKLPK
ncbi:MAG: hypothetical protein ACKVJ7_07275 [Candidatus Poseidoniales archaeon]